MNGILRTTVLLSAVIATAEFVSAGVAITGQSVNLRDNKTMDFTMLVDASRLRTNMKGQDVDTSMIFLTEGDDYKMLILDNTKKEYRVLDRKTMQQMAEQIGGAMAKMQEQMKKMSPEQRAMMEKMMGRMGAMRGEAKPVQVVFTKTGSGTVNGRACTKYEGTIDSKKVSELCAAQPDSLGLTPADFAVVEKVTTVFEDMAKSMGQLPFLRNRSLKLFDKQVDGMPIQFVQFEDAQATSKFEFKDSTRRNFSDADFSTGDAKQVEMPIGPRGR